MIGSVVDKLVSSQELARSFYAEETQSGVVLDETDGSDGIKAFTKVWSFLPLHSLFFRLSMQLLPVSASTLRTPRSDWRIPRLRMLTCARLLSFVPRT